MPATPPARPGRRRTADGRPVAEVLTYTRRGVRLGPAEQAAWDAHRGWVIPDDAVDVPGFDVRAAFDRDAPLVVEIGCGVGEATVALAAARPDVNVLAFEVWRPGVARTLGRAAAAGVTNVRLCGVDAVWSMRHLFADASLAGLWTFFPDPWPKTRTHKRRLVNPAFAALVARRLEPGGVWRLATDWPEYADHVRAVLDGEPALTGGVVERWAARPPTRFERRGLAEGRVVVDIAYARAAGG